MGNRLEGIDSRDEESPGEVKKVKSIHGERHVIDNGPPANRSGTDTELSAQTLSLQPIWLGFKFKID